MGPKNEKCKSVLAVLAAVWGMIGLTSPAFALPTQVTDTGISGFAAEGWKDLVSLDHTGSALGGLDASGTLNPAPFDPGWPSGGNGQYSMSWYARTGKSYGPNPAAPGKGWWDGGFGKSPHREPAPTPVPEPSTLALIGTGLLALSAVLRKKLLA